MPIADTRRARLIRKMHDTGCRLDDAADCADVALRDRIEERKEQILRGRALGLSYGQLAKTLGVDRAQVVRVVTGANRKSLGQDETLSPAA